MTLLLMGGATKAQDTLFSSQRYLGTWTGVSTQQPGAARSLYRYQLVFDTVEKGRLYGKAYVCFIDDSTQRGEILLEATPTDTGLVVQYTKVVLNHAKGNWCLKRLVLRLREETDRMVLSGLWTAPHCPAGFSEVEKARPDPTLLLPVAAAPAIRMVKQLEVGQGTVTIQLWDDQQEDGDVLSLHLDGRNLLQHFALKKEKTTLLVKLSSGEHTLVLRAENLGSIPPNTAALLIDDGQQQYRLVLRAAVDYSEGIIIKVP